MNLFESLAYGLVSGIAQFLPISMTAHQRILSSLFGAETQDPVRSLFIHIAILIAVYNGTKNMRNRVIKANGSPNRMQGKRRTESSSSAEYRLLKNIAIPFIPAFFILLYIVPTNLSLLFIAVFMILNGIAAFLPDRMLQGNKNAKVMTRFDCTLVGLAGALSAITGFSFVGIVISGSILRGADRKAAINWAILLCIPALAAWLFYDVLTLFTGSIMPFWSNFIGYLFSAVAAYLGSRAGLYILRKHIRNAGCSNYAYYCWGSAVFALILFLIAV